MTTQAFPAPLRLRLDSAALARNFRWLQQKSGVPAIPAIKANGYGLGASEVLHHLHRAGAREYAVSSWHEALALGRADVPVLVLHGFTEDAAHAARLLPRARPVLVTPTQCRWWQQHFPGREADLMVDTGMNRLGLAPDELDAACDIPLRILHTHLACADEPGHPLTAQQLQQFHQLDGWRPEVARAMANSAGICAGQEYSFDHVRPGIALYGGVPLPGADIHPVVTPEARVIQIRALRAGDSVGYGAIWTAQKDSRIAILNIGYADGLSRLLAPALQAIAGDRKLPVVGRISMDMLAVDAGDSPVHEGDWLALDFDLPALAQQSRLSQYELLVWLSARYDRIWS